MRGQIAERGEPLRERSRIGSRQQAIAARRISISATSFVSGAN